MNKFEKIENAIKDGKTILGVGPMSWNCIDATIEVANENQIPIKLIASRRQVDASGLGGGYVTDTKTFAEYVREKDKGDFVFIARDHGGPWQGTNELEISDYYIARERALSSFLVDLAYEFDVIHIDPSLKSRPLDEILEDVELYHGFLEFTREGSQKKEVIYEVGTEEHSGQISTVENFKYFVDKVKKLKNVRFVVGNMGYWVKELENIGKFDQESADSFVKICNENGLYLKGHNSDYLHSMQISCLNLGGVHSINIAPEFGTRETETLLYLFEFHRQDRLRNKFIDIAVESGKWKKWMKDPDVEVSDLYKAKICGHYVLQDPRVLDLKKKLKKYCDVDLICRNAVKENITAILKELGWKI